MNARSLPSLPSLAAAAVLIGCPLVAPAKEPLAASFPAGAIAYVETDGLAEPIVALRDSEFMAAVWDSQEYREFESSDGYQGFQKGRKFAEFVLRMDLWEAAEKLLGGEMGVGFYPSDGDKEKPAALVVVRPESTFAYLKQRIWLDPLFMVAGRRVLEGPLAEAEGIKVWQAKGEGADDERPFILLGRTWFAVSTERELLERAVAAADGDRLADGDTFVAARERLGSGGALLRAYVDTAQIAAAKERLGIPAKAEDIFGSFLTGGLTELVARGDYAAAALRLGEGGAELEVVGDADPAELPEAYRVFFPAPPETGTRPLPDVPGLVAGGTIYRDLAAWYAAREELIAAAKLPAFDKFESGIGNLLPGHDIGEDVLPLFGSNYQIVAATQSYPHLESPPGVQLPGFAIIASLDEPERAGDLMQLFFQTLLSVVNFQAAEQKRQPWLIEANLHGGTPITTARFLETPSGEELPPIYNFRPAAARVGDEYVLSSSLELCRSLVDALESGDRAAVAAEDFQLAVHGAALCALIDANRTHLEAARVNEGRSADEAVLDIDRLVALAERLDRVHLSTLCDSDGFRLRLQAKASPAPTGGAAAVEPAR